MDSETKTDCTNKYLWGMLEMPAGTFCLSRFKLINYKNVNNVCLFEDVGEGEGQGLIFEAINVVHLTQKTSVIVCASKPNIQKIDVSEYDVVMHSTAPFPLSMQIIPGISCAFFEMTSCNTQIGVVLNETVTNLKHLTIDSWEEICKNCSEVSVDRVVCSFFGGEQPKFLEDDDEEIHDDMEENEDENLDIAEDNEDEDIEDNEDEDLEEDDDDENDDEDDDEDDEDDDEDEDQQKSKRSRTEDLNEIDEEI